MWRNVCYKMFNRATSWCIEHWINRWFLLKIFCIRKCGTQLIGDVLQNCAQVKEATDSKHVQPWKSLPDPGPCKQKLNSGPKKSLAYIAWIAHASSAVPVSRIVLQTVILAVLFNHGLLATQRSFQLQPRNYAGRPCLEGCLWGNSTSQLVWWFLFESHHEERKDIASYLNLYRVSTKHVQRISCTTFAI